MESEVPIQAALETGRARELLPNGPLARMGTRQEIDVTAFPKGSAHDLISVPRDARSGSLPGLLEVVYRRGTRPADKGRQNPTNLMGGKYAY